MNKNKLRKILFGVGLSTIAIVPLTFIISEGLEASTRYDFKLEDIQNGSFGDVKLKNEIALEINQQVNINRVEKIVDITNEKGEIVDAIEFPKDTDELIIQKEKFDEAIKKQILANIKDTYSINSIVLSSDQFKDKNLKIPSKFKTFLSNGAYFKIESVARRQKPAQAKKRNLNDFFEKIRFTSENNNIDVETVFSLGLYTKFNRRVLGVLKEITFDSHLELKNLPSDMKTRLENSRFDFNNPTVKKINVDWEKIPWYEGEIISWADGDTVSVKITANNKVNYIEKLSIGNEVKVRISGIDTPEKSVGRKRASEFEYQYAEVSSAFGPHFAKAGEKIRMIGTGLDTFGRVTSDVYKGAKEDEFNVSYSVEMVRNGYTLPMDASGFKKEQTTLGTLSYYSYFELGRALKEAVDKQAGFFVDYRIPFWASTFIYKIKQNTGYTMFLDTKGDEYTVWAHRNEFYVSGETSDKLPLDEHKEKEKK
ncbi:thermonuclease family protein [Mycoplasma phocimorsus]|uniref:thermonuclease family protein n=1 Tax=Mycoplasma phocimorsus TaxID=3045839 RepID=UPI0024BF1C6A|nr:thermonuclease family protein [Mycoplasma phocimorsus]MDJ1646250.1 thermonuclease family protein [Mycoplasma phocimorsus]MDJ1646852.1 thermonuclease family protein [Mycoplasma phocimorsus]MDJ1647821.1 thermonuclease family protein [Mycoplasma phocimorsus]MDJ1648617.1 thermonuclease family protein [Mycoplasma phocimorsus]